MKNRSVKDILILCADGLSGIKESINVAFPNTEYRRFVVHQVRNTLKYVANKDKKEFATDLKTIYHAPAEEQEHYPNAMKSWSANWDVISPIFRFSADVRNVIYTTNAIRKP